jgi:hypothetical protein
MSWEATVRFRVSVVVAALALSGCNANQEVNLSSRTARGIVAGPNYNPYNPISYAQNNTGNRGGGRWSRAARSLRALAAALGGGNPGAASIKPSHARSPKYSGSKGLEATLRR